MPRPRNLHSTALAGLLACGAALADAPDVTLTQALETADVALPRPTIGVAAPGQDSLAFHLTLDFRCPAGTPRTELLVTVADTVAAAEVPAGASPHTLRVDVPLKQLEWLVRPEQICRGVQRQRRPDEIGSSGVHYFRLHAGTTAYATLLCAGAGDAASGATTSTPLDVWLSCPAAGSP